MSLAEQDIRAIREITAIHEKHHLARDWDAWLSTCTEDVVFMPPDNPKIEGLGAARTGLSEFPPGMGIEPTRPLRGSGF